MTNGILSQNFSAKSSSENGRSSSRTRAVDPSGACGYAMSLLLWHRGGCSALQQQTTWMAAKAEPSLPRTLLRLNQNLSMAEAPHEDRLGQQPPHRLPRSSELLWPAQEKATLERRASGDPLPCFPTTCTSRLEGRDEDAMLRKSDYQAHRPLVKVLEPP